LGNPAEETFCHPNQIFKKQFAADFRHLRMSVLCTVFTPCAIRTLPQFTSGVALENSLAARIVTRGRFLSRSNQVKNCSFNGLGFHHIDALEALLDEGRILDL